MNIEKRIGVSVGIERDKKMRARLSLMLVDVDTGEVLSEQCHSINIEPGADLSELRKANESHLAMSFEQGGIKNAPWPKIPDAEWTEVEAHVGISHKPSVVEAFQEKQRVARQKLIEAQDRALAEVAKRALAH